LRHVGRNALGERRRPPLVDDEPVGAELLGEVRRCALDQVQTLAVPGATIDETIRGDEQNGVTFRIGLGECRKPGIDLVEQYPAGTPAGADGAQLAVARRSTSSASSA